MSELDALFQTLRSGRDFHPDDALTIELYFAEAREEAQLFKQIRRRLSEAQFCLREVFAEQGQPDRFFFLTFPEASPQRMETYAFEFTRRLGASLEADEANLLLTEGLSYGRELSDDVLETLGKALFSSDVAELGKGWAPDAIEAETAWPTVTGKTIRIAQIDTGHTTHAELAGVYDLTAQLNLVEPDQPHDASDRFSRDLWFSNPGHGTYGASVMASRGRLHGGATLPPGLITGVAPDVTIVPVRAMRSVIDFNQTRIPAAIRHAIRARCDVIAMCLGGPLPSASVQKAMREAVDAGLIIVCAAGNIWPWVVFPAAFAPDRICAAVAAVDEQFRPWEWTARGSAVTVSAPGENVWAARKTSLNDSDSAIALCEGTTLACSLTCGLAALFVAKHGRDTLRMLAQERRISVQELFMRALAHDLTPPAAWGGASDLGAGVINVQTALSYDPAAAHHSPFIMKHDIEPPEFVAAPDLLRRLVAPSSKLAALEIDAPAEPYAQELIWLRYMRSARDLVKHVSPAAGAATFLKASQETLPTPALAQVLASRPHLSAAVGL